MTVVSSGHVSAQNWQQNPIQSSVFVTRIFDAAIRACHWSIVITFSGMFSVGIAFQWTWGIITDNMNVCQILFDNPTPGRVYELLAINRSNSPTLESFLQFIEIFESVLFLLDNVKCTIIWKCKKQRSQTIVNKRPLSLHLHSG